MIFQQFQPIYYKRTLRSTIHMSHRLRRKPPGLHSIAAGGPWAEIETEEAHGEDDTRGVRAVPWATGARLCSAWCVCGRFGRGNELAANK